MNRPAYGYTPRPAHDPHRGVAYRASGGRAPVLPGVALDLRPLAPPARDQSHKGACTGFAGRGAVLGLVAAAERDGLWRGERFDVSPDALYAEARYLDGTLSRDEGSTLARLADVLSARGVPREDRFPYDPDVLSRRAPDEAWTRHRLVNVTPLRHDLDDLRAAFADCCPVVVGIPCYTGERGIASQRAWEFGAVGMPSTADDLDGWHAVTLWGHDPHTDADLGGSLWVQNSWGGWAPRTNGIGTIPADYVVRLANELYAFGAVR